MTILSKFNRRFTETPLIYRGCRWLRIMTCWISWCSCTYAHLTLPWYFCYRPVSWKSPDISQDWPAARINLKALVCSVFKRHILFFKPALAHVARINGSIRFPFQAVKTLRGWPTNSWRDAVDHWPKHHDFPSSLVINRSSLTLFKRAWVTASWTRLSC